MGEATKEWGWMLERPGEDVEVFPVEGASCTADVEADVRRDIKKHGDDSEHMADGNITKVYCVQKELKPKVIREIVKVEL